MRVSFIPAAFIPAACCLLTASAVCGQTLAPRPEFESASVKISQSRDSARAEHFDGSQFTIRNSTIAELLPFAFLRRENAIVGIPPWFRSERYDVTATAAFGTSEGELALMLQSLLGREFRLAVHEEQRPMDAFALTAAAGESRLKKAPGPGYEACIRGDSEEKLEVECTSITMKNLMSYLALVAPDYIDRPAVDRTGLKGTFELKLTWNPRRSFGDGAGLTIFDAITKQTGLKLVPQKLPVQVLVIDHAEQPVETAQ